MSKKFNSINEARTYWTEWVSPIIRILIGDTHERVKTPEGRIEYVQHYAGREWFIQQHSRHNLHPAVEKMFDLYEPDNLARVILEWPHKSVTDPNRLAYTRDEKSAMHNGDSDIKAVVTTVGKYLTRNWSGVPDNIIRDIVAQFTYGGSVTITNDIDRMVKVVSSGPRSCMSSRFDLRCDDRVERHPYAVYDPSLGWSMAVRSEGDEVLGRCLIWTDPNLPADKGYVRSYKRERNESSHSGADEAIETYLNNNGYTKWRAWPTDTPIMKYELSRGGYLMPYIDGGTQRVDRDGDFFIITDGGEIDASNTSGYVSEYEYTCADCGAGFNDGDGYWTGANEEHHVCDSCCADDYTYAYSRRGNQYYICSSDVIEVDGEYYHTDYLSDNGIVELHNGDYTHHDNAVFIESENAYYEDGDDDICYAEDTERCELKNDCWQCTESGKWYTDDEDNVEVDGDLYHPDNAPEPEVDEEPEPTGERVWESTQNEINQSI